MQKNQKSQTGKILFHTSVYSSCSTCMGRNASVSPHARVLGLLTGNTHSWTSFIIHAVSLPLSLSFLADPCLPRLLPLLVILIVHPLGFISRPRWIFKEVGSWQFMVNRLSLDTSASVGVLPLFTKDLCSAWAGFRSLTQIQLKTQKHHSLSLNMQLDKDIVGNSKQMPILTTMYPSNCSRICGSWSKFITKVNWSLGGGGSQGQVPQQQGNI